MQVQPRIVLVENSVGLVRKGAHRQHINSGHVCTHRGNKVVPTTDFETYGRSRANVLTCRFHGWVLGTNGDLRSVPLKQRFGKLDTACLGLASRSATYVSCQLRRMARSAMAAGYASACSTAP